MYIMDFDTYAVCGSNRMKGEKRRKEKEEEQDKFLCIDSELPAVAASDRRWRSFRSLPPKHTHTAKLSEEIEFVRGEERFHLTV